MDNVSTVANTNGMGNPIILGDPAGQDNFADQTPGSGDTLCHDKKKKKKIMIPKLKDYIKEGKVGYSELPGLDLITKKGSVNSHKPVVKGNTVTLEGIDGFGTWTISTKKLDELITKGVITKSSF